MLKKLAAIGVSAAIAFAPLAALAQTDSTPGAAPAADQAAPAKPMKKTTHHHMTKKMKMKKPMAATPAPANPQ